MLATLRKVQNPQIENSGHIYQYVYVRLPFGQNGNRRHRHPQLLRTTVAVEILIEIKIWNTV